MDARQQELLERERSLADKLRELNARECRVIEAEDAMVEVLRTVAREAFRRGAAEARDQAAARDALDAALALPAGHTPVPVDLRVCGWEVTARVIPGSPVSSASALASVLDAVDAALADE
jgi:hypothetical protein